MGQVRGSPGGDPHTVMRSWGSAQYLGFAGAVFASLMLSLKILVESFTADRPLISAIFPLIGLSLGAFAVWKGWTYRREKNLIEGTPTSPVASVSLGKAEIEGRARPLRTPPRSPLTHEEACVYELEVEELRPSGKSSEWMTVFVLTDHVPFEIDDGTGSVPVDPEGADLQLETERRVQRDAGGAPPEPIRRWAVQQGYVVPEQVDEQGRLGEAVRDTVSSFLDDDAATHLAGTSSFPRRYTERTLAAGERAYVFGGARIPEGPSGRDNPEPLRIGRHEGTGTFIVSDNSEAELVRDRSFGVAVALGSAGLLLPASLLGLLALAGIL